MGTDIHTMAEIRVPDWRQTELPGGGYPYRKRWRAVVEPVFDAPYFRHNMPITLDNVKYTSTPYSGRNYDLFAVLADVRNGRGFAGIVTGDRIEPIADPRGVPDDASKRWTRYVERWGMDLHSLSYFTLAELEAALPRFGQHQRKTGVLTENEYIRVRDNATTPESWSGSIAGGGVRVVSPEEYEAGERADGQNPNDPIPAQTNPFYGSTKTYVQWAWETTLADATSEFTEKTMPALARIAPRIGSLTSEQRREMYETGVDPRPIDKDAVRIVFGFDN